MDIDEARRALMKLSLETWDIPSTVGPRNILLRFINEVDKQQRPAAALLKPNPKDEMLRVSRLYIENGS